jgi:hypothetical protein
MIKTQELMMQIDELTKQNDTVLTELDQIKKLLKQSDKQQESKSSLGQDSSGSQQASEKSDKSGQGSNSQGNGEGSGQGSSPGNIQGNSQGSSNVSQLANDLLTLKDLVEKLEKKTSKYIADQSGSSLTEKDVVNLVLTLMNGMIDWASEFVSAKSSGSKQL